MLLYVLKRLASTLSSLAILSVVIFVVIQLPPGTSADAEIARLEEGGGILSPAQVADIQRQHGVDRPLSAQYFSWIGGVVRGNFGQSYRFQKPVNELLAERLPLTLAIGLSSLILTYIVALLIGIYSATDQYSFGDYAAMAFSFIGMSVPPFLLAMVLMFMAFEYCGVSVGVVLSDRYLDAPWTLGKIVDLTKHLLLPVLVILITGTAGLVRVMRANLLDELSKLYVTTARAKGVAEWKLIFKYPVRVAINPLISSIPMVLPRIISGQTIVCIVLNLPTFGPLLLEALMSQDMQLAGSIVLILSSFVFIGMLLSDILLVIADPRVKMGAEAGA